MKVFLNIHETDFKEVDEFDTLQEAKEFIEEQTERAYQVEHPEEMEDYHYYSENVCHYEVYGEFEVSEEGELYNEPLYISPAYFTDAATGQPLQRPANSSWLTRKEIDELHKSAREAAKIAEQSPEHARALERYRKMDEL